MNCLCKITGKIIIIAYVIVKFCRPTAGWHECMKGLTPSIDVERNNIMVNPGGDSREEEEEEEETVPPRHDGIPFPTVKDGRAKLYGRSKELKRLRSCYNNLMQSPSNNKASVFVSGVRGVGKTALVDEFIFQPLSRQRGSSSRRNIHPSSQQQCVVRCNFSKKQKEDDYQSWDEVYSTLRGMAVQQQAAKNVVVATSDDSSPDDDSSISDFECQDTTAQEINDILNSSTSKESIHTLLTIVCSHQQQQQQPLILFLDDCENMNSMALDVLSHLLFEDSSTLSGAGLFIICVYSSTSNDTTVPLNEILDRARSRVNHQILDSSMISIDIEGMDSNDGDVMGGRSVEVIHIYPLTLDVVTSFVVACGGNKEMVSLPEAIYGQTFGIISYVMSAMNELVAKNILRYDSSTTLELSWVVDHASLGGALPNYLSDACIVDNVIHSIQTQIKEQLSVEVQRILTMMACMPNLVFHASILCELLYLEESDVRDIVQQHASSLLNISTTSTLTVSFAHELIRQALRSRVSEEERNDLVVRVFNSHFRKWNEKRMHVGEGNRAPKLRTEMAALVTFFNVINPSSPLTGDATMGGLADSSGSRNSNVSASSDNSSGHWERTRVMLQSKSYGHNLNDGRRRRGGRRRGMAGSDLHKSISEGALKASNIDTSDNDTDVLPRGNATFPELTHNEALVNPFTKLIIGTERAELPLKLCPARRQKQALENIFFPFAGDPKSVLIQHGSVRFFHECHPLTNVAFDNRQCCNERELMIFSHGFIVADFPMSDSHHLMMALTDGDIVTQESLLEYLRTKMMNQEGDVSVTKLREVFQEIVWPKHENVIRSLLDPENHGQVKWEVLHKALRNIFSMPLSPISKQERRAQFASLFSSVSRVDCLDISHSIDPRSEEISHSSLAERSFAITLNDRDDDLICVCSDQMHRDSFVSTFRSGVIRAIEKSSSPESIMMRRNRGWQHLVVRNSPITYVIENDAERLEDILNDSKKDGDDAFGAIRFKLSELDEIGYAAIHYASFLGHACCLDILIEKAGSNASMLDGRGLSPKDLAKSDEVVEILEKSRSGGGDGATLRRPPLTRSKRPSLSSKQSSFRRLRGVAKPRRKVSFSLDLDESSNSLPLFSSDSSEAEEEAPPYTASMPNVWR